MIATCTHCHRIKNLRTAGLCTSCELANRRTPIELSPDSLSDRILDELPHMERLLGEDGAIHRLANAYHIPTKQVRALMDKNLSRRRLTPA